MADIIYKSRVRELAKEAGVRISQDAIIIVDGRVKELVRKAAERAKANHRKTIQPQDF